eukprot:GHVU01123140.1.p3 GENE.GHVU01123140.1~~GHVU01123140.1.p3  ORF type:complete len:133 (+),score=12.82 GHVU01123140.1:708-1106(+)
MLRRRSAMNELQQIRQNEKKSLSTDVLIKRPPLVVVDHSTKKRVMWVSETSESIDRDSFLWKSDLDTHGARSRAVWTVGGGIIRHIAEKGNGCDTSTLHTATPHCRSAAPLAQQHVLIHPNWLSCPADAALY